MAVRIVHTDCMRQYHNLVRIISEVVDAVVYWPYAAWPQASPGLYDSDEEHMFYMNKMMKTEADTEAYCDQWVNSWHSHEEYMALIGEDKIEKISRTATAFLMNPYRKWIRSDAEIGDLQMAARR